MIDTALVIPALVRWLSDATNTPIGDHERPVQPDRNLPWGILWVIPGGMYDGPPFSDPESETEIIVQVDSVAFHQKSARWLGDTVRRSMVSRTVGSRYQVAPPDMAPVKLIRRRTQGPPGFTLDGDKENRVYSVQERFALYLTEGA